MPEADSLEGKTPEQIAELATLAQSLMSNPKTRMGMLHLTKTAHPDVAIPEVDIPGSIRASMKPELDRLAKLEKDATDRDMRDRVDAGRRKALKEVDGISEADLTEIEKVMMEHGIADHVVGAKFYAMSRKAAEPTPPASGPGLAFNKIPELDLKPFDGNLDKWAWNEASKTIDGIRSGQIKV